MRKVFFSFHYVRDAWSVGQVRNSWLANPYHKAQPFFDKAEWEAIKKKGDPAIKAWIDIQISGTSTTVVLIGPQTLGRRWVKYEVDESLRLGKGLIGVTLEGMKQADLSVDNWTTYTPYGPLNGNKGSHPVYSWSRENGRQNLPAWIESAARSAGR